MKRSILIAMAMLLTFGNQIVIAGTISDTYPANSVLTATKMDNIKTAVNDNDANITSHFSGDGSDGNLTVSGSLNWSSTPPTEIYFSNITINAGQTLTVPAGTTIRCSGTFTNNGTISVLSGARARGAFSGLSTGSGPNISMTSVAHPGDTIVTATLGDSTNDAATNIVNLGGGTPGLGINQTIAISSFSNFRVGGGAGAGYANQGNDGGGLLKVYCNGAIVNNGDITATGVSGTNQSIAGGGGGIVILASRTSVDNTNGTINVSGGNGSNAGGFGGNGGGGGGGIIILVSPTLPLLGIETVTGGTGGTVTTANIVTTNYRTAGAGGGASGGNGGSGGSVSSVGTPSNASNGSDGYVIILDKDPAMLVQ